jgi:transcription-repair coupling factor (superfamily II helicase)
LGLARILTFLQEYPRYQRLLDEARAPLPAEREDGPAMLSLGLVEAARPYVAAALQADWPAPIVVLCDKPEGARRMVEQIRAWSLDSDRVRYFHAPDAIFYDRAPWDAETTTARLGVLATLAALRDQRADDPGRRVVIVTSVWALLAKSVSPLAFRRATRSIRVGDEVAPLRFLEQSVRAGYRSVAVVEEPGTFGQRGGIIDIFPPNHSEPLRIEFFGDQIETIRTFDPTTQRSQAHIQQAFLAPASEALPEWGQAAAEALRRLDLSACTKADRERIQEEREKLARGEHFPGVEHYLPYLYPRPANLLSFLPPQALVLTDDLSSLQDAARGLENQALGVRGDMIAEGQLPRDYATPHFVWDDLQRQLASFRTISLGYGIDDAPPFFDELTFTVAPRYGGQLSLSIDDLIEMRDRQKRVLAVTRQGERLADLLRERNIHVSPSAELAEMPQGGAITLVDGIIDEGWGFTPQDLVVFTDVEIFGWSKPRRRPTATRRRFAPESFFADLSPGDYVVHAEYGIGRYQGMVKKKLGDIEREYLEIEYAGGDRLYVPIHQASRVSRYLGGDDREPYLHRLGGTEWETVRNRAQRAVRDIAAELLELYAAREVAPGYAFAADTEWQRELEASFPYEETEDQLSALEQVKADMEKPKPMDRLICGDVGYGKTEVALRAAFKAVMDGRQVALLVPTTVLAQQHFYTFRRRLRAFPVTVEMLSRFRSPEEREQVLEGLRSGKVDIVIGTHRLLSQDVTFKSLGLLIIDEEQRFGVSHKERLKRLRHEVDVLTLTATPIPRTLYMALSGVRDMSVIDTPPEDRLPVRTFVSEYDQAMLRKAILREIDRGGQVYFVHNRVQDIYAVADELQEAVPEASLAVGHGQMDDAQLAQVMLGFAQGEHQVLVCTTIIESGLDIPNVNTIIINNSDHLGLAQLYQLRGRVGRGANRAYAYLFYKPPLTDIAHSRLQTIQEATELGAGFRVAMRDLEIRGAGELLGAEQHGHIAAIGFDLYCRLLQQAVDELCQSGDAPRAAMQRVQEKMVASALPLDMGPSIDLPLSAYLPEDVMPDTQVRLRFYRRLARIDAMKQVEELAIEMTDRFGQLPEPVENLLYLMRVRILADEAGVPSISGNAAELTLALALPLAVGAAQQLEGAFPQVRARGTRIWLPTTPQWRKALIALLQHLSTLQLVSHNAAPQRLSEKL